MDTGFSPLDQQATSATPFIKAALSHPTELQKIGLKGPALGPWAQQHKIVLPALLYDTLPVDPDGVLARVGTNELILEAAANDPLFIRLEELLAIPTAGVYRLDQQAVTLVLHGTTALPVLAQTCGLDLSAAPVDRILYTRIAGASCAVLPRMQNGQATYRLWVDYTLGPYLWETLATIITELAPA